MKNSDIIKELEYFLIYDFIFCGLTTVFHMITNNLSPFVFSVIMLLVDTVHYLWVNKKLKGE